jgi:hypothetical protein
MRTLRGTLLFLALAGMFVLFAGTNKITCIPAPPDEPVCAEPLDCEGLPHMLCVGEWTCQEGLCAWECAPDPTEPPESECMSDSDCGPGEVCQQESWCPPCVDEVPGCLAPCYAYGICEEVDPLPAACYSDSDCGEFANCNITNDCCAPPGCQPGLVCPDVCVACGVCEADDGCCAGDADCGPGSVCISGVCQIAPQPGSCWSADDCHPGQECWGVITCPCGAWCFAAPQPGTCKWVDPPQIDCLDDSECPEGFYCEISSDCGGWNNTPQPPPVPCYAWGECLPMGQECQKIDPFAYGFCEMLMGAAFDGQACVYVSGCGCDDCTGIFDTMQECMAACF